MSWFKRVFQCLASPLSEQQRASFQGCSLHSLSPRRKPLQGPLTGHTLDQFVATGRSSDFHLGQLVSRLQLKGQPHLWDKLLIFALSEHGGTFFCPSSSLEGTFQAKLIKFPVSGSKFVHHGANKAVKGSRTEMFKSMLKFVIMSKKIPAITAQSQVLQKKVVHTWIQTGTNSFRNYKE